ncbi:unnamed protein product [Mytilus coruscus]|uniref:Mab-21-like HhH/H2TH-like domain-containing protein n=1 Tax=Mytilus coruscus TaxID=42192 RepID=A0A6J8C262_MYTCO|nr:unnamed protein product [Mytilus coruscus]
MKLAKAMTQLQRNVILIIKALQKSSLQEYCEILTTFHWKTVVYWVSEKTESHILENQTEETILIFLQNILAYMVDCLKMLCNIIWFLATSLPINKKDEIHDMVSKIAEIQENPIGLTSFTGLEEPELSLQEMLTRLIEMNKPTVNDDRHNKYCSYIMRLLSYFSGERCMVAGSTQEQTRLRIRQDKGDFDYLIISAISIPASALEYREDLPCFVHINGLQLVNQLPTVQLIDGRFLPSNLLSEIKPEAFKHIRDFQKLLSIFGRTRRRNSLHVDLDHNIKPGKTLVSYSDVNCPALDMKQAKSNPKLISENLKQRIDEQISEEKVETMSNLIKVANVIDAFSKADIKQILKRLIFYKRLAPLLVLFHVKLLKILAVKT